jgi:hypothetical protein
MERLNSVRRVIVMTGRISLAVAGWPARGKDAPPRWRLACLVKRKTRLVYRNPTQRLQFKQVAISTAR